MKKHTIVLVIIICLILAACASDFLHLIENLPELDLTTKEDSIYRGAFDIQKTPINVILNVEVKNSRINDITIIEHNCSPIGKKAENIISRIINSQSLNVDVVSGATISSIAILKAVENALE
jgi:uncharacterized protein with FMN-binding domain